MTVTVSEGLSLNSNYIKMGRNARRGLFQPMMLVSILCQANII